MGGGGRLFGAAIVTGLAIVAWVLGHMIPFFYALKFAGLLRVSEEDEVSFFLHPGSAATRISNGCYYVACCCYALEYPASSTQLLQ